MTDIKSMKAWRALHGWTGMEAAEKLGIPYETYRKIEQGKRPLKKAVIIAMQGIDAMNPVSVVSKRG